MVVKSLALKTPDQTSDEVMEAISLLAGVMCGRVEIPVQTPPPFDVLQQLNETFEPVKVKVTHVVKSLRAPWTTTGKAHVVDVLLFDGERK
jgi:hypothetical protein